jgi:hypothetical protein
LMAAIGRVESGRRDPITGVWGAWPWTINAEGRGAYFDSKADVIRAVQGLQARGVRSIDVGCMQVNLMHHPSAFPSLESAFEPSVNADYAARFLAQLREQTGDWTKATAHYHSANPWEGQPYAEKVTAVWPEEQRKASLSPPPLPGTAAPGAMPGAMPVGSGVGATRSAQGVPALPARPLARMFAMAGMPQGMAQGMAAPGTPQTGADIVSPRVMPMESRAPAVTTLSASPGRIIPLGAMTTGGPPSAMATGAAPGRGLDFYRAMPIRTVAQIGLIPRVPGGLFTRGLTNGAGNGGMATGGILAR